MFSLSLTISPISILYFFWYIKLSKKKGKKSCTYVLKYIKMSNNLSLIVIRIYTPCVFICCLNKKKHASKQLNKPTAYCEQSNKK